MWLDGLMPRIRSIHYDACKSEKLQAASAEAERCYWRLLPFCDDEGRAEDDPRSLRSQMFQVAEPPLPAVVVDGWLDELDTLGLIVRYEVAGCRYLAVTRWGDYQKPQKKTESHIPPVPDSYATSTRPVLPGVGEGVGEGVQRRCRPKDDFAPTDAHREYARLNGLNLEDERVKWVTHCEAKGVTYAKLNAGFTTWLHRAVEFGRGKANGRGKVNYERLSS